MKNVSAIKNITMGTEAWDEILNEYSTPFTIDTSPIVVKADSAMNPSIGVEVSCPVTLKIEKLLTTKPLTKSCTKCEGGVWNNITCRFCGGTNKVVSKWGKVEKRLQSHKKMIEAMNTNKLPTGYKMIDIEKMIDMNVIYFAKLV